MLKPTSCFFLAYLILLHYTVSQRIPSSLFTGENELAAYPELTEPEVIIPHDLIRRDVVPAPQEYHFSNRFTGLAVESPAMALRMLKPRQSTCNAGYAYCASKHCFTLPAHSSSC